MFYNIGSSINHQPISQLLTRQIIIGTRGGAREKAIPL